jgi:hypothetical protein
VPAGVIPIQWRSNGGRCCPAGNTSGRAAPLEFDLRSGSP